MRRGCVGDEDKSDDDKEDDEELELDDPGVTRIRPLCDGTSR